MHFAVFYSQSRPLRPMSSLVLSFISTAPSLVVRLGLFRIFHLLSPLRELLNFTQVVPNSSAHNPSTLWDLLVNAQGVLKI